MPSPGSAAASANDATVAVDEYQSRTQDEQFLRALKRLRSDVDQCRRVVDELGDAPAKVEEKYAKYTKGKDAELKEARKMVTAAKQALKDAEKALKEAEG